MTSGMATAREVCDVRSGSGLHPSWVRQGFVIDQSPDIPQHLFIKLLERPALKCGLQGILARIEGTGRWCLTIEGASADAKKFTEYVMLGQTAFGTASTYQHGLTKLTVQGFHVLRKHIRRWRRAREVAKRVKRGERRRKDRLPGHLHRRRRGGKLVTVSFNRTTAKFKGWEPYFVVT